MFMTGFGSLAVVEPASAPTAGTPPNPSIPIANRPTDNRTNDSSQRLIDFLPLLVSGFITLVTSREVVQLPAPADSNRLQDLQFRAHHEVLDLRTIRRHMGCPEMRDQGFEAFPLLHNGDD